MGEATGKAIGITLISAAVGVLVFWATTGALTKQTQQKAIEATERIMEKPIRSEVKSEITIKHENSQKQDNLTGTNSDVPAVLPDSIR